MLKGRLILGVVAFALGVVPGVAQACRISDNQTPIMHQSVPVLSDGLITAEVEIVANLSPASTVEGSAIPVMEARIISMLEGDFRGDKIRIEFHSFYSSCDVFPYIGQRGIVVGKVLAMSDNTLIIEPIRAPSAAELRSNAKPSNAGS